MGAVTVRFKKAAGQSNTSVTKEATAIPRKMSEGFH